LVNFFYKGWAMALLEVKGLTKYFGGLAAINELNFDVNQGEILGLIGPNGAGKTTAFNLISGFLRPNRGSVIFKGYDITGLKPNKIAALGLVRTFQTTVLFHDQTVLQNIAIALHLGHGLNPFSSVFRVRAARKEGKRMEQRAMELLESMELAEVRGELAGNLPHGSQRALGVTIALATNPELIMLDEPVTGMTAVETEVMMSRIKRVRERGITVLLVEHDMKAVMGTCDRLVVLNFGKKIAEGTPAEMKENKEVVESYLGVEENE
jgi:branched-chain amino acid transport system ATP-binding protein